MIDNHKEIESRMEGGEHAQMPIESPKPVEQNLEVESWMAKIEKQFARVPNQTNDVADDTVIVQPFGPAQGKQPPVTLPINQQQMALGKKAKSDVGIAWLVVWAIRQIKIFARLGKHVRLQDIPEAK